MFSLYFIVMALLSGSACGAAAVRGVGGSGVSLYEQARSGDQFTCLDGSATVAWTAVNDDYCDCADGSDEPGTAACAHTGVQFFCANEGHRASYVYTSHVNDGVCDCCDGSDEWRKPVAGAGARAISQYRENEAADAGAACPNRCQELGQAFREQFAERLAVFETGAAARDKLVHDARRDLEQARQELATVRREEAAGNARAEQLTGELDSLETRRTLAANLLDERKEAAAAAVAEAEQAQTAAVADLDEEDFNPELDPDFQDMVDSALQENDVPHYSDHDAIEHNDDDDGGGGQDDSTARSKSEAQLHDDKFEQGPKDDATLETYVKDGKADSPSAGTGCVASELRQQCIDLCGSLKQVDICPTTCAAAMANGIRCKRPDTTKPLPPSVWTWFRNLLFGPAKPKSLGDKTLDSINQEYDEKKSELDSAKSELSQKRDRVTELESTVNGRYGPDNAFFPLRNRCFTYDTPEYQYQLCLFKDVRQNPPGGGGGGTLMGTWQEASGWPEDGSHGHMMYAGGAKCWNGPERSTKITLECGQTDLLIDVDEPNKCEYTMKLVTPAACDGDALAGLRAQQADAAQATVLHDEL